MMSRPFLRRFSFPSLYVVLLAALLALALAAPPAAAQCGGSCNNGCVTANHNATRSYVEAQHDLTRQHIMQEMRAHQRWWFTTFFDEYIIPAQMMMAEQLTAVGMQQMEILGTLWDAKHQLESQMIFQDLSARAHKDYHSAHGMCTIATAARSLAAGDSRAAATTHIMGQRSLQRQLGSVNTLAAAAPALEKRARVTQFINRYCDPHDSNGGQVALCRTGAPTATMNLDVDYNRLVETPLTLNLDLTDGGNSQDEAALFALSANLFSHDVFPRMTQNEAAILENQDHYMNLRAIVAKRNVAENSLYNIIGMKARGSAQAEQSAGYVGVVLQQLGVPEDEIFTMLGNRPSYFALMDVLAQKLYQRPEFYTDLYDKPANIARKDVAMRAIDLMVDRDLYKSDLRTEAMLAVLLEIELGKHQRALQDRLRDLPRADTVAPAP